MTNDRIQRENRLAREAMQRDSLLSRERMQGENIRSREQAQRDSLLSRERMQGENLQYRKEKDQRTEHDRYRTATQKAHQERAKHGTDTLFNFVKARQNQQKFESTEQLQREKLHQAREADSEKRRQWEQERAFREEQEKRDDRRNREQFQQKQEQDARLKREALDQRERAEQRRAETARTTAETKRQADRERNEARLSGIQLSQAGQEKLEAIRAEIEEAKDRRRAEIDRQRKSHDTSEDIRADGAFTDHAIKKEEAFSEAEIDRDRQRSANAMREQKASTDQEIRAHHAKTKTDTKASLTMKRAEHELELQKEERLASIRVGEAHRMWVIERERNQLASELRQAETLLEIKAKNAAQARLMILQQALNERGGRSSEDQHIETAKRLFEGLKGGADRSTESLAEFTTTKQNAFVSPPETLPGFPSEGSKASEKEDDE